MTTAFDFEATTIDGEQQSLTQYKGQVLLVVNTASKCGFTPQYEGLERLHRRYADEGLAVLGFPCDQFGGQEFDTEAEIADFCSSSYDVSFPMFAKVDVNGDDAHPLFRWLRGQQSSLLGDAIKWNFTKFLVGRDGDVVKRYGSSTKPTSIAPDIERQLALSTPPAHPSLVRRFPGSIRALCATRPCHGVHNVRMSACFVRTRLG